jgi:hypothetical protein
LNFAARQRWIAGVAAAVYFVGLFGIPLPPNKHSKDDTAPFPCQDHLVGTCGCFNAEQCWSHCCCFSDAERLAWAANHKDHVAASVLRAIEERSRNEQVCADTVVALADRSQCIHHAAAKGATADEPRQPEQSDRAPVRWVIGPLVFNCQGQGPLWMATVVSTLPPPAVTCQFDLKTIGSVDPVDQQLLSVISERLTPPPRV